MRNHQLSPLLDQFVCLRLIDTNSLDLSRFQFDYDLSLSALILNADGTTYGRFGSWKHQKDPAQKSIKGFKASLTAALSLHKFYPKNKARLKGKQPRPLSYKTPLEIPQNRETPTQLQTRSRLAGESRSLLRPLPSNRRRTQSRLSRSKEASSSPAQPPHSGTRNRRHRVP
ncbi:MAG: hypothetical protein OSA93_00080 [Akkermansiaceae bacterium]|nr:hypothetical protein [Akkermansiaceae bacterium]